MDIIDKIPYNEFDHLALMNALRSYNHPKDKITKLLRDKRIIQIKRGVYIQGFEHNKGVYSKEIISNMLYGPSYISLEYALAYYGLIPERVDVVTSITMKRRKEYNTPLGLFLYFAINKKFYSIGLDYIRLQDGRGFIMATPERALLDKLYFEKCINSQKEMQAYLFENLRIEESALKNLNRAFLKELLTVYRKKSFLYLQKTIEKI